MKTSNLYEKLVNPTFLLEAWEHVKTKNSQGGIDKISVEEFEKNTTKFINELSAQLQARIYVPHPYQHIAIPKNENNFRSIGLLTVHDKIVQQAIRMLIEPLFENTFTNSSYGYRPEKGPAKAISRIKHIIGIEKKCWAAVCDIQNYFDTIPHSLLFQKLEQFIKDNELLKLMEVYIKMGKVKQGSRWQDCMEGIPQGAVLSPLLSNFYLHELDILQLQRKNGYVRYADDFIILCEKKNQAEAALALTEELLTLKLKLKIHPEKQINHINNGIEFMGIMFKENEISLSETKKQKIISKISELNIFENGSLTEKYFETIKGIRNYYGKLLPENQLIPLDHHLINTIEFHLNKIPEATKSIEKIKIILNNILFITQSFNIDKKNKINSIANKIRLEKRKIKLENPQQIIEKRKREYRKLESQQMELVVSSYNTFIGKSKKGITVKSPEEKTTTVSAANLHHIIILSPAVTISSDAVYFCMENNIAIDFFSRQGKHYASVHQPYEAQSKLWLAQVKALENGLGAQAAVKLVQAKISNQVNTMKYFHKYHKKTDLSFAALFAEQLIQLEKIKEEADSLSIKGDLKEIAGKLFSIEGRSAECYWKMVVELINEDSDFKGREKQGAKDLVNSLLNYGYAILYSRLWDAALRAKLNPYISYLHSQQDGKPTLVFDLIEPFRAQAVDRVVISMLQKGEKLSINDGVLNDETRKKLSINILERLHRFEIYRGEKIRFSEIIKKQAKEFAAFILGEIKTYKPYRAKW